MVQRMAEYMNKELFLESMGLVGDETKYGNRDSEHQGRSYSTWMAYEIMDRVEDSIETDVISVVRCKDCRDYKPNPYSEGNEKLCMCWADWIPTEPDDFCSYGERKADD